MTVTSRCLVQGKRIENSQTIQYTSTGLKTIIDGVTIVNTTAAAVLLSINVVANGGAEGPANLVADALSIAEHSTYLCPELAGRRLDAGDFVSMVADTASALSLRMDGRVITS